MKKNLITYGTGYFESNANILMEWNDKIVVLTDMNIGHNRTLTNSMEQCLHEVARELAKESEPLNGREVYQWCPGEGLFKVHFELKEKITRDMPPCIIDNVKWEYISENMNAIQILYGTK